MKSKDFRCVVCRLEEEARTTAVTVIAIGAALDSPLKKGGKVF